MWYVFTTSENGYFYSWAQKIGYNENLTKYTQGKNIHTMQASKTKTQALKTAAFWNDGFRIAGNHIENNPEYPKL